jgi:tRNA(Ile2) C34 agmatinyltransferase TiaS
MITLVAGSGIDLLTSAYRSLISHKDETMKLPRCPNHKRTEMEFCGFGDMGSSHGNWYRCPKCGKTIHVYDRDLEG